MTASVIIPTYNRASLLPRAIESVRKQTHTAWELWIMDDGSSDDTPAVLDACSDSRINHVRIAHGGVSAARNAGVRMSRSRAISFLDSDDEWLPNKLSRQLEYWAEHPELPLIYSSEIWMRGERQVTPPEHYRGESGRILSRAIRTSVISPSTAMLDKSIFEQLGGFDESYPVCEDYDLWLRLCSRYEVGWISEPLIVRHGGRTDQLSESTPAMDYWRVRSMARLHATTVLSSGESTTLAEEIERRGRILLGGYRTRGNSEAFGQVVQMIQTVVPEFEP